MTGKEISLEAVPKKNSQHWSWGDSGGRLLQRRLDIQIWNFTLTLLYFTNLWNRSQF